MVITPTANIRLASTYDEEGALVRGLCVALPVALVFWTLVAMLVVWV